MAKNSIVPNYDSYSTLTGPIPFDDTTRVEEEGRTEEETGKSGKRVNTSNKSKTDNTSKPRKMSKNRKKSTPVNTLVCKTYKLPEDLVLSVERIAYWQRRKIQDVVAEAIRRYRDTVPEDDVRDIPR